MGTYDPMPADNDGSANGQPWGNWLRGAVGGIDSRLTTIELSPAAAGTGTAGEKNIDSFTGSTDTAKLQAFITYSNAQTYKPLGRLGNRQYTWNGPIDLAGAPGLTLAGPHIEREYKSTSSYKGMASSVKCLVSTTSSSGYFWGMSADTPAISMSGIHFDGGSQNHDFIQTSAATGKKVLVHSLWERMGWSNYRNVFYLTVQGGWWHTFHIQNCAQYAFYTAGGDYTIGGGGYQYIDHCYPGNSFMRIWGDSAVIDNIYMTPTSAGTAVQYDGGTNTRFLRMNLDSPGQKTTSSLCQGSLIQLRGGTSTWVATRLFGCMYNPAGGTDGVGFNKGWITATGGNHMLAGISFESQNSRVTPFTISPAAPAGTPHVYATSGATVTVGPLQALDDTLRLRSPVTGTPNIITDLSPYKAVG